MGQERGEKWTAEAVSQPTAPKSDRLLGFDDLWPKPLRLQHVLQQLDAWLPCPRNRVQVSPDASAVPALLCAGPAGGASGALRPGGLGAG